MSFFFGAIAGLLARHWQFMPWHFSAPTSHPLNERQGRGPSGVRAARRRAAKRRNQARARK